MPTVVGALITRTNSCFKKKLLDRRERERTVRVLRTQGASRNKSKLHDVKQNNTHKIYKQQQQQQQRPLIERENKLTTPTLSPNRPNLY